MRPPAFDPATATPNEFCRWADWCAARGSHARAGLWRVLARHVEDLGGELRALDLAELEAELEAERVNRDARGRPIEPEVFGFRVSFLWGAVAGVMACGVVWVWAAVLG